METEVFDVVVIGGGLSGLTAAYEIKKKDNSLKVVVLEAKDRLGGRTITVELNAASGSDVWDLGGQWVCSTQLHILSLIEELGLEIYPQYSKGTKLMQVGRHGRIQKYNGPIPYTSPLTMLELELFSRKVNKIATIFPVHDVSKYPDAKNLDGISLKSYLNSQLWTDTGKRIIDIAIETIFGVSSDSMSTLFFLMTSSAAGGLNRLSECTKGNAQEAKVKGGTQQISHLMAHKIGFENICLSHVVTSIKQDDDYAFVKTKNSNIFKTKRVIIAIPLPLCDNINFFPALPSSKLLLYRNMFTGNYIKFIITYRKPFWREMGYSGEIVTDSLANPSENIDCGPVSVVYDATTVNGNAALVGLMSAERGFLWADVESSKRKEAVLSTLAKFFGDEAKEPLDYIDKNWYMEPFNGGCPAGILGTGTLSLVASDVRNPCGRIHWASTETATKWMGYMDGAVQSGRRAAAEVLKNLSPESVVSDLEDIYEEKEICRPKKVFRWTFGLGLAALAIVVFRKAYFRIAV